MASPRPRPPGWTSPASCGQPAACSSCWITSFRPAASFPSIRRYHAGVDLEFQGEKPAHILTLLEGWLLLCEVLKDGRRQILHIAVPGDVLVPPLDGSASFGIQAATDVVVCAAPLSAVTSAQYPHPAALHLLLNAVSRNAAIAYEHLTTVGRRTARERVALLLVELYYRCRRAMKPDHAVRIPLTQSIIADALGLTSVHVNRTLKALRADGLITYESNALRILDPDGLAAVACWDVEAAGDWLVPRPAGRPSSAPPDAPTPPGASR